MSELRNPHDLFFRETFSRPEVARDFIAHYLPADVVAVLDLGTLELQKDSFIDADLREHFSDLLYRVRLKDGDEANIYLLLEHKSSPDVWVPFQLLRYMVRIWERSQQEKAKKLPPILPVVVYHGRAKWRVGRSFDTLFEGPEAFRPYWPSFTYDLQDLSHYSDAEIRGALLTRATVLLLKYAFDPTLRHRLPSIVSLVWELADEKSALEYLHAAFRYLSAAVNEITPEVMRAALEEAFIQDGGPSMTDFVAEWIEQGKKEGLELGLEQGLERGLEQGLEKGLEQGLEKGLRQSILRVLIRRFNQVPAGIEARLQRLPVQKLELALDEASVATDLADFERRLGIVEEQA